MSYGAPIHGIGSDGEAPLTLEPVRIRLRTPEERERYFAAKRAEMLAAGDIEGVRRYDAVHSVMSGETADEWNDRKAKVVLSHETLSAVAAEALRAHEKHRAGGGSLLDASMGVDRRLAALGAEFGEVCRALTYEGQQGVDHLITELTQVASVALTWAESLRRWQRGASG